MSHHGDRLRRDSSLAKPSLSRPRETGLRFHRLTWTAGAALVMGLDGVVAVQVIAEGQGAVQGAQVAGAGGAG